MPYDRSVRTPSRLAVGATLLATALMTAGTQNLAQAAPPADTVAPTTTVMAPAADAVGVPVAGTVMVTFSEQVQGVGGTSFTLRAAGAPEDVAAEVSYDDTTRIATLDPSADLAADTKYTVTLAGGASAIRDAAGNPLLNVSWTFTTTAPVPPVPSPAPVVPAPTLPAPALSAPTPAAGT
jgi:hypothetical protein